MPCLVLALVAPAQSWGSSSRFDDRDTGTEPTKSGIVGLLAAGLGRQRHEPIDDLASLRLGVRVDCEGVLRSDYQTALGAIRASGKQNDTAVVSNRAFLSDAAFTAILEHDDPEFLQHLHNSLERPRWPLYLGRRAFPPAGPLTRGVTLADLDDAIMKAAWVDPSRRRQRQVRQRLENDERIELRTVIETAPIDATFYVTDQPLRFEPREFAPRPVRQGTVPLTLDMLPTES